MVIDTLIAVLVTSLFLGLAYLFLFPKDPTVGFEGIEARVITPTIRQGSQTATEWSVRTRTANYFSRATLPWLTSSALDDGRMINIRMQVLDPENEPLLKAYARFRSNHPGESARWTPARVRNEIYASVLQAALCQCEARRLVIKVGFSPAFWVLSLDITDTFALVTGQEQAEPALIFHSNSSFFSGWRDDFEASFTECRTVVPVINDLTRNDLQSLTADVSDRIREFFLTLGLSNCSADVIRAIVTQLGEKHHYA